MNKKWAYYNDIDPNVCEWVKELIKLGQIAPGEVDTRSIKDVDSTELKSFSQIHLFCGIGIWSYALRQAGWSDDRPVFSGSCPCQPFSTAGKQRGINDDRHLWPEMFRIVRELRPVTIFGEQVSSAGALAWWDLVAGDLEGENYAATAIDLPSASIGAPHIRSRLFWMGHSQHNGRHEKLESRAADEERRLCQSQRPGNINELGYPREPQCQSQRKSKLYDSQQFGITSAGKLDIMADSTPAERRYVQPRTNLVDGADDRWQETSFKFNDGCQADIMAHSDSDESAIGIASSRSQGSRSTGWNSPAAGNGSSPTFWDDAIWLPCRDGKHRATHPSIHPLIPAQSSVSKVVDGTTTGMGCGGDIGTSSDPTIEEAQNSSEGRMMRLRGFGNGLCSPVAIEFISAAMEII